jgi:hypothetical protein
VFYQVKGGIEWDVDKSVNRIVNDLLFIFRIGWHAIYKNICVKIRLFCGGTPLPVNLLYFPGNCSFSRKDSYKPGYQYFIIIALIYGLS